MFHPRGHPLERGWVGRIDGDRVVHLAAQTLQSFFTGGGSAREHAEYPLADVVLLAPVLHPPAVRVFEEQGSFAFANPAAIVGPLATVRAAARPVSQARGDRSRGGLLVLARIAAIVGADEAIAGFTILAEWRDPRRPPPKDRDFALGLGPVVVSTDTAPDAFACVVRVDGVTAGEGLLAAFEWEAARAFAGEGTRLVAGDLLACPALATAEAPAGSTVEVEVDGIGALGQRVAG
ncbi:MAG: hypothetical protein KatS3mg012_0464 [Gaiellaceae bacterium]|jgi:hypothetical protein|nr:MAG: hypothetical protein KatS3mg012_0464 [Gaiellaceae bacterium]